jgi:hypothetical protein
MNTPNALDVRWRKSSYSGADEGNCVEVASAWRKSSHSQANEGDCVEVARAECLIAVRDSKHRDGDILGWGRPTWRAFVTEVKSGAFDRP